MGPELSVESRSRPETDPASLRGGSVSSVLPSEPVVWPSVLPGSRKGESGTKGTDVLLSKPGSRELRDGTGPLVRGVSYLTDRHS